MENAHAADADAIAACRLLFKLASKYNLPAEFTLDEIHEAQIEWRAEQAASLAEYFKESGKPQNVDGSWPLRRTGSAVAA
jgi:DNA polymerase-3 subunit epsilon